jgi:NitT/TauT family transport system substrate-binding protein
MSTSRVSITATTRNTDRTGSETRARRRRHTGFATTAIAVACLGLVASACGSSGGSKTAGTGGTTLKIGYFPNITHAPALVGVQSGIFAKDLGSSKLATPQSFSAGPAENAALLSGSIDIAFEGPSSALSAYSASKAVTIIAGAAAGGAGLVVNSKITSPSQLKGTKLGSPQLANTQDIALRYWLKTKGYTTTSTGGGDVEVEPSSTGSGTIVTEFESGQISGAWMPEPYEQELIAAGGHVLVPESTLWAGGKWATTNVVVRTAYLKAHPATVSAFLKGLVDTLAFMKAHKSSVLDASWDNITFTDDPLASTLAEQVKHGEAVGLLKNPGNLTPIFTLGPLDAVLKKVGQAPVKGL